MKFEIAARDFSAALKSATAALDEKAGPIAALGMVRIDAAAEGVALVVDTLDRRCAVTVAAAIAEPGAAAARADALAGLAAKLPPNATVRVSNDGDTVVVSCGRSRWRIAGLPLDDLPQSPTVDEAAATIELDSEDLLRLLVATTYAVSHEETRYYLNGVYLHATDKALRAVATDGQRLARCDVPTAEKIPGVIVPRRTCEIATRLLKPGARVTLRVTEKLIQIELPGLVLTSKLIAGTFPDYARVLPAPTDNAATVDPSPTPPTTYSPLRLRAAPVSPPTSGTCATHSPRSRARP